MKNQVYQVVKSYLFTSTGETLLVKEVPCFIEWIDEVPDSNPAEHIFVFSLSFKVGMQEFVRNIRVKHSQRFVVAGWPFRIRFYSTEAVLPNVELLEEEVS